MANSSWRGILRNNPAEKGEMVMMQENGWGDVLARLRANGNSRVLLVGMATVVTPGIYNRW